MSLSELGGVFLSDNFVGNERSYQHVLSELPEGRRPADAYIGVGPEQNFTYIAALKPRIAFIVDIRRQNMILHLMYKALFELSADRAEFMSRLFSRVRPEGLGPDSDIETLFDAFRGAASDRQMFDNNLQSIWEYLVVDKGFPLDGHDEGSLDKVLRAFAALGPTLSYSGAMRGPMPTFEEMMRETDAEGNYSSFLASEESFLWIKEHQKKNLLIPVVGNFAGTHAVQAVGQYLKDHNATVTAFYTSNVEQYLFMDGIWPVFYGNVSTLPVNSRSVFIRGMLRDAAGALTPSPVFTPLSRYQTTLFSIEETVKVFNEGGIQSYNDILLDVR